MLAPKKRPSIGNSVVKNRKLCQVEAEETTNQRCNARRCESCQLMCNAGEIFTINGMELKVPSNFNCKTSSVIYCAQCKLCSDTNSENTYFGQTSQPFHKRANGHRSDFTPEKFENSALSTHSFLVHNLSISLDDFKFMIVKKVRPLELDREEFKLIEHFKTNTRGINRCKVARF